MGSMNCTKYDKISNLAGIIHRLTQQVLRILPTSIEPVEDELEKTNLTKTNLKTKTVRF